MRNLVVVGILVLLVSPVLLPLADPMTTRADILEPPQAAYPLGTDALGRDVLSRMIYGGRHTVSVAIIASLIALIPGTAMGILLGLAGDSADRAAMVVVNTLLAVPGLVFALVVLTLLGSGAVALAIGASQVMIVAQVMRGAVRSSRRAGHIEAARSLGAGWGHIVWWHILADIRPIVLAYAGVVFSYSLLNGAALSFLGLGVELGQPDWGAMLAEGRSYVREAPWISLFPGLAITLTVMAVNGIADRYAQSSMP
jgi:peptide/nickel transport system permease protein